MNFIKIFCNNCNASLDVDLDHLQAFCPYCGQKLMIDFDQLGRVLSEKEKTKRALSREEEQTKRIQMEHEYQERQDKRSGKELLFVALFMLLCVGLLIYLGGKEDRDHIKNNEVKITFSAKEVNGEYYEDVVKRFETLGFTDIELAKDEDLVIAFFSKDGTVEKVTISGDSSFSDGDWIRLDSKVVITYHTFKDKSD